MMRNSSRSTGMQRREAAHREVAAVAGDRQVGDDGEASRSPPPPSPCARRARRPARRSPAPGSPRRRGRGRGAVSSQDGALDRGELRLARDDGARARERGLRVLEPVAGEDAGDPPRALGAVLEQPGDARGRRRLAEDALVRGEEAVRVEDLRRRRPRGRRRGRPPSRPSPPPSARGCRSGSRSRRSPGRRRARRGRAGRSPRPASRASAAARPAPRSPSSRR